MTLVERIRHTLLPLRLKKHFVRQFFIFVCVARILIGISVPSGGGKIASTGQFGQIESSAPMAMRID